MSKTIRNVLIILAITIIIIACLVICYQQFNTKTVDGNSVGKLSQNNNISNKENLEENTVKNTEKNTEKNNATENNEEKVEKEPSENDLTPPEEKAINLAKEQWRKDRGSTAEVTFGNVSVQGDGKFIVCVSDNITTISVCFYEVDLKTGIVKER